MIKASHKKNGESQRSNLSKFQNFTTNILQNSAGEASFFYIYVLVSLVQHVQKMGSIAGLGGTKTLAVLCMEMVTGV